MKEFFSPVEPIVKILSILGLFRPSYERYGGYPCQVAQRPRDPRRQHGKRNMCSRGLSDSFEISLGFTFYGKETRSIHAFYLRRSRQIRERKVLFFFFLLLLGDLGGLFSDLPCTLKKGASRENFSSKGVHSEKTFLQKGCIQRKLFFKRGASREKFSSKRVHPDKTFLQNGCIQTKLSSKGVYPDKTFLQNGCIQTKLSSKGVYPDKTFLQNGVHQDKTLAFLLM